ncbi:MAG: bifunctional adenosylcobinamide kinase/adenosylcobinamide-phosphate guanylyltransferase [Blastochloris sp.]|nr:bifunctional adenosylcobinamide kinase/adenosylcobinamide-phosphate guanylyltransferase [Blastochloris sp.]
MGKRLIFLLGGARSGKSSYAEKWAQEYGKQVLFVATAQAFDDEMRERIAAHRATRPAAWHTLEAPLQVGNGIQQVAIEYDTLVLDCVTLLASNALLQLPEDCTQLQADEAVLSEVDSLIVTYKMSNATWLVISNEVGMGIVPPYRLGRLYRDALGRANQRIAQVADEVQLLVAGISWNLKR